jgi:hypothetical protein
MVMQSDYKVCFFHAIIPVLAVDVFVPRHGADCLWIGWHLVECVPFRIDDVLALRSRGSTLNSV